MELPRIDVPPHAGRAPADARPHWVVCGRLVASKRVDRAIREAARRNVDLTVIGDGPMRGELETLAAQLSPRARFVGQIPREQALAILDKYGIAIPPVVKTWLENPASETPKPGHPAFARGLRQPHGPRGCS